MKNIDMYLMFVGVGDGSFMAISCRILVPVVIIGPFLSFCTAPSVSVGWIDRLVLHIIMV